MNIKVRNLNIHYEQAGAGDNILLLHGWGYDCTLLRPLFDALSKHHRVTMLDFPGHGSTQEPVGPYTVYDFAALVSEFLKALEIQTASIIGHSFGCRVAIILAAQQPQLVQKLILCGAAGIRPKRTLRYYYKVYSYKTFKKLLNLPIFSSEQREKWQKSKGSEDYRKLSPVMKQSFIQVVNEDLLPLLPQIHASTLLIWGETDDATPLDMGRTMEKLIPDCGLALYQGAGHYAFLEQLPRTLKILDSFLGG